MTYEVLARVLLQVRYEARHLRRGPLTIVAGRVVELRQLSREVVFGKGRHCMRRVGLSRGDSGGARVRSAEEGRGN